MTTTPFPDPVGAAKSLRPQIVAAREEIDGSRRLPPALSDAMTKANLFQLYLPASMGGPETDPITAYHAVEQVSIADGSAGWCCFVSSGVSMYSGWVPPQLGRELFGNPPDLRIAGSFRPEDTARAVDGGYRVNGRWDFASGIHHSNWLFFNCIVLDENVPRRSGDGSHISRMMMLPVEQAEIHDSWSVMGLRGTGSNDFSVDDRFVPEDRTFALFSTPLESGPLFNPRASIVMTWTLLAANALGMAQGAMAALLQLATNYGSPTTPTLLRDRAPVQKVIGEAEAIINCARTYTLDAVGKTWAAMCKGKADPGPEILQGRLAVTHAVRESVRAIDLLYHAAGSHAVRQRNDLERYFRDIHTAVQHIGGLPSNYQYGGQVLLGLPPGASGW